jgi:hypothetical protein
MPLLEAFGPVMAVCAIAAIHAAYYFRHCSRATQQVISVVDHSGRGIGVGAERIWDSAGACLRLTRDGLTESASPTPFENVAMQIAAGLGTRVFAHGDVRVSSGDFIDVVVCMGDLEVDGPCTFYSPVKVAGDLIVSGQARFMKPVAVNGQVKVQGKASFAQGLVCKGQAIVLGNVEIGSAQQDAWVVARVFKLGGEALLSGQITAIEADSARRAA